MQIVAGGNNFRSAQLHPRSASLNAVQVAPADDEENEKICFLNHSSSLKTISPLSANKSLVHGHHNGKRKEKGVSSLPGFQNESMSSPLQRSLNGMSKDKFHDMPTDRIGVRQVFTELRAL